MSISGMRSSGSELRRADVRRDRDDRRHLGAARRGRVDEAVEIARKLVELAGLGERAAVIDIRMRDQHAGDAPLRLMRGDEPVVIVDRRVRPEPADQAEDAAFFAGLMIITSAECRRSAP